MTDIVGAATKRGAQTWESCVLVALVFFLPFGVLYDGRLLMILSQAWVFYYTTVSPYQAMSLSILGPVDWVTGLPLSLLRLSFAVCVVRFYRGTTTMRRAILVGLASELPTVGYALLVSLPALFIPSYRYALIGVPTPFLLVIGWLLMKHHRPQGDASPEWSLDKRTNVSKAFRARRTS